MSRGATALGVWEGMEVSKKFAGRAAVTGLMQGSEQQQNK